MKVTKNYDEVKDTNYYNLYIDHIEFNNDNLRPIDNIFLCQECDERNALVTKSFDEFMEIFQTHKPLIRYCHICKTKHIININSYSVK